MIYWRVVRYLSRATGIGWRPPPPPPPELDPTRAAEETTAASMSFEIELERLERRLRRRDHRA